MPYGVATAKQVKEMAALLDAYCADHAIPKGPEREAIGQEILALFNLGHRTRMMKSGQRSTDSGPPWPDH